MRATFEKIPRNLRGPVLAVIVGLLVIGLIVLIARLIGPQTPNTAENSVAWQSSVTAGGKTSCGKVMMVSPLTKSVYVENCGNTELKGYLLPEGADRVMISLAPGAAEWMEFSSPAKSIDINFAGRTKPLHGSIALG